MVILPMPMDFARSSVTWSMQKHFILFLGIHYKYSVHTPNICKTSIDPKLVSDHLAVRLIYLTLF